jgi:transcriptional regulator with XRE-family HTH domain
MESMESIYLKIGQRLRELRLQSGMTQQTLAEKAGISVSFLSFLEKGDRKGSLQTYADLAKAFGIEISELFDEKSGKNNFPKSTDPFPQLSVAESDAVMQLVKTLRKRKKS